MCGWLYEGSNVKGKWGCVFVQRSPVPWLALLFQGQQFHHIAIHIIKSTLLYWLGIQDHLKNNVNFCKNSEQMLKRKVKHTPLSVVVSSVRLRSDLQRLAGGFYLVMCIRNLEFAVNSKAAAHEEKPSLLTSTPLSCSLRVLSTATVQK